MFSDRQVEIFIGAFGSGKTEVSINYALALRQAGHDVIFADMDVVTPYFRSREARAELEEQGIKVIAPPMGSDSPAIPAEVLLSLQSRGNKRIVLDVGGDKHGAIAIGQFKPHLPEGSYHFNFVINTNRPFTSTEEGIMYILGEVEAVSRLKTTALINNTNLGPETTVEDVKSGSALIQQIADKLGVPVRFVAMSDEVAENVKEGDFAQPVFKLDLFMVPAWRDGGYDGVTRLGNKGGKYKAAMKREYWLK
ncbi:MAG: ATP-binding protein [bacterium]|jgi:hypothetical protein